MRVGKYARWILVAVAALVALEIAWLLVGNLVLVPNLPSWVGRRPDKFQVEWESARTYVPVRFHLQGVKVRGWNRRADWTAEVESVSTSMSFLRLLKKEMRLTGVRASGVRVDIKTHEPKGERRSGAAKWTFTFSRFRVRDLERLTIDEMRLEGRSNIKGTLSFRPREVFDLHPVRWTIEEGRVAKADGPAVELSGRFTLALRDLPLPGWGKEKVLDRLELRTDLRGRVPDLGFINQYLEKLPTFRMESGAADVDLRVKIREGDLLPGSRLRAQADNFVLRFIRSVAAGDVDIDWKVSKESGGTVALLQADLANFTIRHKDREKPHVRGEGLRFSFRTQDPGLKRDMEKIEVRVEMPEVHVDDVTFYNNYLPEDSGLVIRQGSATISGNFRATATEGEGEFHMKAVQIGALFDEFPVVADFRLDTRVEHINLRKLEFDLSGTKLAVENTLFRFEDEEEQAGKETKKKRPDPAPWWSHITLTKAHMRAKTPIWLDMDVKAELADIRPVMAIFSGKKKYKEAKGNLENRKMEVEVTFRTDEKMWEILGLDIDSKGLVVRGCLRNTAGVKDGALFARKGIFKVGIEFVDDKRSLKLFRGKKWFEQKQSICEDLQKESDRRAARWEEEAAVAAPPTP